MYRFDVDPQGWGGHPEGTELQPGLQVVVDRERAWRGQPSLRFSVDERAALVGVKRTGPVTKVRAQIYVVPADGIGGDVHVGMVGFNGDWQWRDDGFRQAVPLERWIEVTWDVAEPGIYHEIGLKFDPRRVRAVYLGQIEIQP